VSAVKQPSCFGDGDWKVYLQDLKQTSGTKILDICFDCTVAYKTRMVGLGKCDFPEKKLGRVTEFR
jgi:hypothetical protein